MRFDCPVEGYEECFVEFTERWTRAEIRGFSLDKGDDYMNLVKSKIAVINLKMADGHYLTCSEEINDDSLDAVQWEVFQWFILLPQLVVKSVLDLGEGVRRQLLPPVETPETANSAST